MYVCLMYVLFNLDLNHASISSSCFYLQPHTNTEVKKKHWGGIWLAVRRKLSDMSGHVDGEVNYKVPLFLPSLLQSETLIVLQWGAAPSGGWTGRSVSFGGPKAAMQWAMNRPRRETTPGILVCHRKVWIRASCTVYINLFVFLIVYISMLTLSILCCVCVFTVWYHCCVCI